MGQRLERTRPAEMAKSVMIVEQGLVLGHIHVVWGRDSKVGKR